MANSLNLNFADYFILRNLSMIAYIIEIEKSKFINLSFHEIEQSEPGRKIKFCVYFHPVGYVSICIDLQSQKYFVVQVLIRNLSVYKHFSANQGLFDL